MLGNEVKFIDSAIDTGLSTTGLDWNDKNDKKILEKAWKEWGINSIVTAFTGANDCVASYVGGQTGYSSIANGSSGLTNLGIRMIVNGTRYSMGDITADEYRKMTVSTVANGVMDTISGVASGAVSDYYGGTGTSFINMGIDWACDEIGYWAGTGINYAWDESVWGKSDTSLEGAAISRYTNPDYWVDKAVSLTYGITGFVNELQRDKIAQDAGYKNWYEYTNAMKEKAKQEQKEKDDYAKSKGYKNWDEYQAALKLNYERMLATAIVANNTDAIYDSGQSIYTGLLSDGEKEKASIFDPEMDIEESNKLFEEKIKKLEELASTPEGRAKLEQLMKEMGIDNAGKMSLQQLAANLMMKEDAYKKGVFWMDKGYWHKIIREEKDGSIVYKLYITPGTSVAESQFSKGGGLLATYDEKSGKLLVNPGNKENIIDILKQFGIDDGKDIKGIFDKSQEYRNKYLADYNKAKNKYDSAVNKISENTLKIEKYYNDLNNLESEIADKNATMAECKKQLDLYNQDYYNPNIQNKDEIKNKIDELNKNITTLNTSLNKLETNLSTMRTKSADIYSMMRDREDLRQKLPELFSTYDISKNEKVMYEYQNKDYLFAGKDNVPRYNTLCTWLATEYFMNYTKENYGDIIDIYHDPVTGAERSANELEKNIDQMRNLVQINNPEIINLITNVLNAPVIIGYKDPNYDTSPWASRAGHYAVTYPGYTPWVSGQSFDINMMRIFETGSNNPGEKSYGNGFGGISQEYIKYYILDKDMERFMKLLNEL